MAAVQAAREEEQSAANRLLYREVLQITTEVHLLHMKEVPQHLQGRQAIAQAAVAEQAEAAELPAVEATAAVEQAEVADPLAEEEDNQPLRLTYNEKDSYYISADACGGSIICTKRI